MKIFWNKKVIFSSLHLLLFFFFGLFSQISFAQQDLSHIMHWIGKYPFDKVDGHELYEDKQFLSALEKSAGQRIRNTLVEANKIRGRYFREQEIVEENGLIRISIDDFGGPINFKTSIFINPRENYLDVCWNDIINENLKKSQYVDVMYFHTGEQVKVMPSACLDIDYNKVRSGKYTNEITSEQQKYLGNWKGTLKETNKESNILINSTIKVMGNPSIPGDIKFEQIDDLQLLSPGVFTCSKSRQWSRKTVGSVWINSDGSASFYSNDPPAKKCVGPSSQTYKAKNNTLVKIENKGEAGILYKNAEDVTHNSHKASVQHEVNNENENIMLKVDNKSTAHSDENYKFGIVSLQHIIRASKRGKAVLAKLAQYKESAIYKEKEKQLLAPLLNDLKTVVYAFAKNNKYSIIFDENQWEKMYNNGNVDTLTIPYISETGKKQLISFKLVNVSSEVFSLYEAY